MAQGQIKKGFFFYFGLFVLLLISVFMICLVIMMFNPGKSVLGMKYFTANKTIHVEKTTDDANSEIDFSDYSGINIKCTYANVTVKRCRDNNLRKNGLYIVNKAIGFAGGKSNAAFSYKVYESGGVLNIELHEPEGFMYFSKNIEIILLSNLINDDEIGVYDFSNLDFTAETTTGTVSLGYPDAGSEGKDIYLKSVDVTTTSGSIYLDSRLNQNKITSCNLTTKEGRIRSYRESSKGSTFDVGCPIRLDIGAGSFGADYVSCEELTLKSKTGTVDIGTLKTNKTTVTCSEGNYKFEKVEGDLSFDYSESTLASPNIVADYINGDFDLSSVGGTPDVQLGHVTGKIAIVADKGRAVVKKAGGMVEIDGKKNFAINIAFVEGYSSTATLKNNSENITMKFLGGFGGDVQATTNKGAVYVKVTTVAGFESEAFKNTGDKTEHLGDDKITINVGLNAGELKNPLTVEGDGSYGGSGKIVVYANTKVDYQLMDKTTMQAEEVA